ncbi:sugar phosphate isomerase/epimerase family protein [Rugosimonospora africana]|uniref:sugar phosphate isomerase/epimerase family protein n=1 Tax=Rugosimonospora africana TaxID=556532 RepID=UPI001942B213|nr:sugar phosphate isomerase/epimerase family protein [Rugosimonospora africana]
MRFSVFTASTPDWTPAETVARLAAAGADGVEWRVTDQVDDGTVGFWAGNRATWPLTGLEERLPEMARLVRDAGLACSAIGGYARCYQHEDVDRLLAATAALGAERVRVMVPALNGSSYPALFEEARKDYAWVAERAAHHGVKALVELHHQTICASASAALRLLDGLDPAHVGVIHDAGNLLIEGQEEYRSAFAMLGPYLAHVHVKNVAWRQTGRREDGSAVWSAEWAPLRDGLADLGEYFGALREHGYDGWVTLEDFSTALPLEERTRDNLAYVRALAG